MCRETYICARTQDVVYISSRNKERCDAIAKRYFTKKGVADFSHFDSF